MRKQTRTLLITLAAGVVLAGVLLLLLYVFPAKDDAESSADETSSDTSITLIDKSTDDKNVENTVTAIEITNAGETFTFSVNKEKQLVVDAYAKLLINESSISSLQSSLTNISATKKVADSMEKAADFGLDKPSVTVKVTYHDGTKKVFELGNEAPLDAGYYIHVQGDDAIYLVDLSLGETLKQSSLTYIGTSLITAPTVKDDDKNGNAVLRDMKLSGSVRKSPFAFRKATTSDSKDLSMFGYILTSPKLAGTDDSTLQKLSAVTSLTATEAIKAYPTEADLKKYGLTTPYSVGDMSLAVETSTTPEKEDEEAVTSYYNVAQHTVKLGNKNENGEYYALIDDIPVIYLVSASAVPWAEIQYNDIASKLLFLYDITTLESVTLQKGSTTTTFTLTHYPDQEDRDKSMVVKSGDKTYSTPDFRSLYQVLMGIARHSDSTSKPTGDPIFSITIKRAGSSKPFNAKFYSLSASTNLCVLNDGDSFAVKSSTMSNVYTQLANYLDGKEVKS